MSEQQQQPTAKADTKKRETKALAAKTGSILFHSILIVLLLILLAGVGWCYYSVQCQYRSLHQQFSSLQTTTNNKIAQLQKYDAADWVLPEVKFLLNMAEVHLTVTKQPQQAVKLLQLAETRVNALANSEHFANLKQALNSDITAINAAPKVEVAQLVTELDVLNQQIANLPTVAAELPATPPDTETKPTTVVVAHGFWQRFWQSTQSKFKRVVIVHKEQQKITSLQPLLNRLYCKQRLQLMVGQAKWALLQQNQQLYQDSLTDAINLTNSCFSHNLAAADPLLQALTKLQQIKITTVLPTALQAQQELAKLTEGVSS